MLAVYASFRRGLTQQHLQDTHRGIGLGNDPALARMVHAADVAADPHTDPSVPGFWPSMKAA
jgi:hypothetical protein